MVSSSYRLFFCMQIMHASLSHRAMNGVTALEPVVWEFLIDQFLASKFIIYSYFACPVVVLYY